MLQEETKTPSKSVFKILKKIYKLNSVAYIVYKLHHKAKLHEKHLKILKVQMLSTSSLE